MEISNAADQDLEEIESLTFTELKQRYLQLKQKVSPAPAILPVSTEPQTSQEVYLESTINDRQTLVPFDSLVITPIWIRTPRILLVEDDPSFRRIIVKFLR